MVLLDANLRWRSSTLAYIYYCCFLVFLRLHNERVGGEVTLTPSVMTSVCPGDQLLLTCNTSTGIQQWIIVDPNTGMIYTRLISVPTTTEATIFTPLEVQSFMFNFAVISASNMLPLISTLTVDSVTSYLNTSRIECLESASENREVVNVNILGSNPLESVYLDYHLMVHMFELNNVKVMLHINESSQETESGSLVYYYNVTSPLQVEIQRKTRTRFQLLLPYNTYINMSIVASLCGHISTPTIIQLIYTNCGHPPLSQLSNAEMNDPIMVTGNTLDIPVMKGTNVSFSCRFDFTLIGPNSSMCMGNGQWEPDPREVECKGPRPFSTITNSTQQPVTVTIIVGSLIGVLTITVIIIVITVVSALKRKGSSYIHRKKLNTQSVECPPHDQAHVQLNDHIQSRSGQIVYADLGPSSLKQSMISLSLLDDNRINYAKLNYNANQKQQTQIQANDEHPADKLLNLDTLLIQLKGEVTAKWYTFGETIGLRKEELEKFTNYPPEQSIIEMLDYWLRNHIGQPKWKEIAGALRQLGFQRLSTEFENIYEAGQLPYAFNESDIVELPSALHSDQNPELELPTVLPRELNFNDAAATLDEGIFQKNTVTAAPSLSPIDTAQQFIPPRPPKPKF